MASGTTDFVELTAGPAVVGIAPHAGGRLASLTIAGVEFFITERERGTDPLGWGAFAMVPWAGRVRRGRFAFEGRAYKLERNNPPDAIHGTAWSCPWDVLETTPTMCRLAVDLGWPLGGRAVHTVELEPNALNLTLEVHAGDTPIPAAAGWHPWWRRDLTAGGTVELSFKAESRWERDSGRIPTGAIVDAGERPPEGWDDCFTNVVDPVTLVWPGAAEVTIESDCRELVIYDQPAHALCVEPQTAPPDPFNLGRFAQVEPGTPLRATTRWSWVLG